MLAEKEYCVYLRVTVSYFFYEPYFVLWAKKVQAYSNYFLINKTEIHSNSSVILAKI
jgi:hypothetical protein